jgi:hypothetical protein
MSRNKKKPVEPAFVVYDVLYQDGTRSSNRRIPTAELDPLDGEASILALLERQDQKIAQVSGNSRGPIKSISRAGSFA